MSEEKIFTDSQIKNVIHNSVCDYDCLVEDLYEMMYPEEYELNDNVKIKVGDYIRTDIGIIGKVTNINDFRPPNSKYAIDSNINNDLIFIGDEHIKKHSKLLFELIEIGDFVNDERVIAIDNYGRWIETKEYMVNENNITTIVTKEQFEQVKKYCGGI